MGLYLRNYTVIYRGRCRSLPVRMSLARVVLWKCAGKARGEGEYSTYEAETWSIEVTSPCRLKQRSHVDMVQEITVFTHKYLASATWRLQVLSSGLLFPSSVAMEILDTDAVFPLSLHTQWESMDWAYHIADCGR